MIGSRIKLLRKKEGLSQKAFADMLNTSSGYISEVEQEKIIPGGKFFISLKQIINIDLNWLITGEGSPYLIDSNDDNFLETSIKFIKHAIEQDEIEFKIELIKKDKK